MLLKQTMVKVRLMPRLFPSLTSLQASAEEDRDEGIKDLVDLVLKKMVGRIRDVPDSLISCITIG